MRRRRGAGGASGGADGAASWRGPGGSSSVSTSGMVGGFSGPGERTGGTGSAGRGDAGVSTTYLFSSPRSFRPCWASPTTGSSCPSARLLLLVFSVPVALALQSELLFPSSFRRQRLYELYAL